MQYLLMLYVPEGGWEKLTPEQREQGTAAYFSYTDALRQAGALVGTGRPAGEGSRADPWRLATSDGFKAPGLAVWLGPDWVPEPLRLMTLAA